MAWKHEDAKTVGEMIYNESNLMNHRLGWLMQWLLVRVTRFCLPERPPLIPVLAALGVYNIFVSDAFVA
jgi:hypothetical protein